MDNKKVTLTGIEFTQLTTLILLLQGSIRKAKKEKNSGTLVVKIDAEKVEQYEQAYTFVTTFIEDLVLYAGGKKPTWKLKESKVDEGIIKVFEENYKPFLEDFLNLAPVSKLMWSNEKAKEDALGPLVKTSRSSLEFSTRSAKQTILKAKVDGLIKERNIKLLNEGEIVNQANFSLPAKKLFCAAALMIAKSIFSKDGGFEYFLPESGRGEKRAEWKIKPEDLFRKAGMVGSWGGKNREMFLTAFKELCNEVVVTKETRDIVNNRGRVTGTKEVLRTTKLFNILETEEEKIAHSEDQNSVGEILKEEYRIMVAPMFYKKIEEKGGWYLSHPNPIALYNQAVKSLGINSKATNAPFNFVMWFQGNREAGFNGVTEEFIIDKMNLQKYIDHHETKKAEAAIKRAFDILIQLKWVRSYKRVKAIKNGGYKYDIVFGSQHPDQMRTPQGSK